MKFLTFNLNILIIIVLSNLILIESLEEGSPCTSFDNSPGVCKVLSQCNWAVDKIKSKEIAIGQLIRCGFKNRDVIICCKHNVAPPLELVVNTKSPASTTVYGEDRPPVFVTFQSQRKSIQACEQIKKIVPIGVQFNIIGGEQAEKGEFPHQVVLGYPDELDPNKISYDCGGSLISKNFILTAAHCVNNRQRQPSVILLGKTSLNDDDELDPILIPVKKIIIHSNYTSRRKYDDIALIELEHNVEKYNYYVKPACLYTKHTILTEIAIITGFGIVNQETRRKSDWLMKADVTEVPLTDCREKYATTGLSRIPDNLRQTQMCATGINSAGTTIDACQGDSGGPIQIKELYKGEKYYTVVGVTSFGASCGSQIPGVYTRVSEYLDWIEPIVWPSNVVI
ncbi:hypothetical protein PVAND_005536 [Polypedilum vanderplanki]|uniref:Peptidase S1 domain-containing protein n=1 Tax=Polypedilum vanderplanki TaxID=319348 RepID=A0A9J6C0A3_POLVA|nr:hypothetical protein PVAND_005536 [Polypedilum vanderplanki]